MNKPTAQLVIFSDLDGCLLNKIDYDWSAAAPLLERLKRLAIPVVLNSSKTVSEIAELVSTLPMAPAPFISENGGAICWGPLTENGSAAIEIPGISRSQILRVLSLLKADFRFRSFVDLGIDGVMRETGLPKAKAERASHRQSTEPLIWDDSQDRIESFRRALAAENLTLTKGGRFWHVAGSSTKGSAMQDVMRRYQTHYAPQAVLAAGIGDSPIDQSMLNAADYPIGIPSEGEFNVQLDDRRGIRATFEGSKGWAEAVGELLTRIGYDES